MSIYDQGGNLIDVKGLQMALRVVGIALDEPTVLAIMKTFAVYNEVGDDFSLQHASEIIDQVNLTYKNDTNETGKKSMHR